MVYTAAGYVYHRETSVLRNNIEMKSHLLIFHIPALNPGFQNDCISFHLTVNDPLHTGCNSWPITVLNCIFLTLFSFSSAVSFFSTANTSSKQTNQALTNKDCRTVFTGLATSRPYEFKEAERVFWANLDCFEREGVLKRQKGNWDWPFEMGIRMRGMWMKTPNWELMAHSNVFK